MTREHELINVVSEVLNIHPDPISDETVTIELTMGELFKITEKLRQPAVSGSLLSEIRKAVADYMWSEGCSCCRSSNHDENGERLAELLGVKRYEDGSGYDWDSVRKQ